MHHLFTDAVCITCLCAASFYCTTSVLQPVIHSLFQSVSLFYEIDELEFDEKCIRKKKWICSLLTEYDDDFFFSFAIIDDVNP